MARQTIQAVYQRWRPRSLSAKFLLPLAGLMVAALLVSIGTFVIGTATTQNQLLRQEVEADLAQVQAALVNRTGAVTTAAQLLAHDPSVAEAFTTLTGDNEGQLRLLNNRAVIMRDRFTLDLIQIYNAAGEARTNLVSANLYQVSSLIGQVPAEAAEIQVVAGRPLYLSRSELPDGLGTVITGIDFESELARLLIAERLPVVLGLNVAGVFLSTGAEGLNQESTGRHGELYVLRSPLRVDDDALELVVARPTGNITRVTNTGLLIVIGTSLVTTLMLLGVAVAAARAVARPVQQLAAAAETLAHGDLHRPVDFTPMEGALGIGQDDELGVLTLAFARMVGELQELYANLERKVETRTAHLAAAATLAQATSASLEVEQILQTTVALLRDKFGFYHAGVFIIEPDSEEAVLREATGEAGKVLRAQQYSLAVGSRSLVGQAAATKQPIVAQDVRAEPTHLHNPRLPHTRAEAALPLRLGQDVIGVLDVQSQVVDAFTPELVGLLTTLADQVAVAVQNARLFGRQRELAEGLQEIDRMKTQFLANMSHELRTPLNSIIGFAQVLLKGIDGPLSDVQQQDITLIYNSGQHLLGLVNDILDISKINAGKMELVIEPVDLRELVESVLITARVLAKDKPVQFYTSLDANLSPVQGDGLRLRQVLLNLMSNAVKFTEKGMITVQVIQADGLSLGSLNVEPHVRVSVYDTGPGIAPADQKRLFQPFSQADGSPTRRAGGSGLGLAISRHIIELHGGQIWAKSEVGQGSTFTFLLPLQPKGVTLVAAPVRQENKHATA